MGIRRHTVKKGGEPGTSFWFWCPGCEDNHRFAITRADGEQEGPLWGWDGNVEKPTFTPSLRVCYGRAPGSKLCHLFLRAGMVHYLGDCTHSLAGKTIPVQDDEWDGTGP